MSPPVADTPPTSEVPVVEVNAPTPTTAEVPVATTAAPVGVATGVSAANGALPVTGGHQGLAAAIGAAVIFLGGLFTLPKRLGWSRAR